MVGPLGWNGVKEGVSHYHYFYRYRSLKGTKKHERKYLDAKDEDDYRNRVLLDRARSEVLDTHVGGWTREGLTPSENRTMDIITDELSIRKDLRDPIISVYIKQLGLKIRVRNTILSRLTG